MSVENLDENSIEFDSDVAWQNIPIEYPPVACSRLKEASAECKCPESQYGDMGMVLPRRGCLPSWIR
jgi:hypothetical protein